MYAQAVSFCIFVETISKEFYLSCLCYHSFLPVYFEKQLLFYERDDVLQCLLCARFASAEDYHIVCVSYKAVSSAFQLMVELIERSLS